MKADCFIYGKRERQTLPMSSAYTWFPEPYGDSVTVAALKTLQLQWRTSASQDYLAYLIGHFGTKTVVIRCLDDGEDDRHRPHTLREEVFVFPTASVGEWLGCLISRPESVRIRFNGDGTAEAEFEDRYRGTSLPQGRLCGDFTVYDPEYRLDCVYRKPMGKQEQVMAEHEPTRIKKNGSPVNRNEAVRGVPGSLFGVVLFLCIAFAGIGVWLYTSGEQTSDEQCRQIAQLKNERSALDKENERMAAEKSRTERTLKTAESDIRRLKERVNMLSDEKDSLLAEVKKLKQFINEKDPSGKGRQVIRYIEAVSELRRAEEALHDSSAWKKREAALKALYDATRDNPVRQQPATQPPAKADSGGKILGIF